MKKGVSKDKSTDKADSKRKIGGWMIGGIVGFSSIWILYIIGKIIYSTNLGIPFGSALLISIGGGILGILIGKVVVALKESKNKLVSVGKYFIFPLIAIILSKIFKFGFIGYTFMMFIGIVTGLLFFYGGKKIKKYVFLSGWIGFLIPWTYYFYKELRCIGSHCGDVSILPFIILIISIIGIILGGVVGYLIYTSSNDK